MLKKLFAMLFFTAVFSVLCMNNVYASQTEVIEVPSDNMEDAAVKAKVYLPKDYDADRAIGYPVLYLLHGSGGGVNEWDFTFPILDKLIAEGSIPASIAVSPNTGNSYWVDSETYGNVETMFHEELIPYIDSNYNTVADRTGRTVAGFSMGGFGALRYALVYPETYSKLLLLSPSIWDTDMPPVTSRAYEGGAFGKTGEPKTFDPDKWNALNYPASLKKYSEQEERVEVYIVCGDKDWNHLNENKLPDDAHKYNMEEQAVNLYAALHRKNLFNAEFKQFDDVPANPCELRIIGGEHDDTWAQGFEQGILFLKSSKKENKESQSFSPKAYDASNYPCPEGQKGTVTLVDNYIPKTLKEAVDMNKSKFKYKIYLPKGYEENENQRFPVIYLLHGAEINPENVWDPYFTVLDHMIAEGKIPKVIAVAPMGIYPFNDKWRGYWVDSEIFGNFETAVIEEFISYIDQNYKTIPTRNGRALAGYSMGGYAATRYAYTYPELFSAVTLLSPFVQDKEAPATCGAVTDGAFGKPFEKNLWDEKNYPAALLTYVQQSYRVPAYIYAGDDDWNHLSEKEDLPEDAYKYNAEVQALRLYRNLHRLKSVQSPAELRIVNGEHDTGVWIQGFSEGLVYMFKNGLSAPKIIDPNQKSFTISSSSLDRTMGIKVSTQIRNNGYSGKSVVVFQLLNGETPISIVAVEKNIQETENITAHFNVTGRDYSVKIFVLDSYGNINDLGNNLAEPVTVK